MRKYLYFLSADAAHLQSRLDRLAKRGMELKSTEGLFTGEFEETKRSDLSYLVVPYGAQKNFPCTTDFSTYGWTLMGGFNGMAVFKSLPCMEPDAQGVLQKLGQDGCVHPDKHTLPILQGLLFLYAAVLFLLPVALPELAGQWYLTYFGLGLPVLRWIVVALLVVNLLSLRTYLSAWIHGVTPWLLAGASLLYLVTGQLDHRDQRVYLIVILLIIAAACALSFWRMCKRLGIGVASVCCVVLCLGLLFPTVDRIDITGNGLHNEVKNEPVISLNDLGNEANLTGTGYRTEGTFLVRKTTYWEVSEAGSVSSEVYQCLTGSLAEKVAADELSRGTWVENAEGWCGEGGETVLLRFGKTVAVVSCDRVIDEEMLALIWEQVF